MMTGLTEQGLRGKIIAEKTELTKAEAIDLFILYPTLTEITWEKKEPKKVKVNGLNLVFNIK